MNACDDAPITPWNSCSLTRLSITFFILTATAHFLLGWRIDLRNLLAFPCRILGVTCFLALISFTLADMLNYEIGMLTTIIIGNSNTFRFHDS